MDSERYKRHGVVWGFRFPSVHRLKTARAAPVPPAPPGMTRPHLDVHQWLDALDLSQYTEQFTRFNGVEELLHYSEAEIKDLGIKNSAHRARIVSSLLALKIKYENGLRRSKENSLQRHSVAVDRRIHVNIEDSTDDLLSVVAEASQSKSLCTLIMEPLMDPNADPVALKKALEWELSLDTRDLCSHAWYHGAIPRPRAEEIVERDGQFLVRDCTSQPGNYVLSCRTKGQPLHFVINKVIIQPETVYERIQYQFEDDAYDTVPDLITFYVGSGKPISAASGARIQYPRNRMYPLSFYASKYPPPYPQSRLVSPVNTPLMQNQNAFRYTPYNSNSYNTYKQSSPSRNAPEVRPRLPAKKQRSQSLTPAEAQHRASQEKCNSADGVIQSPLMTRSTGNENVTGNFKFSTHSLPRNPCTKISLPPNSSTVVRSNNKHIVRVTSDPSLSPCAERKQLVEYNNEENEENLPKSPPPKPSRIPSLLRTDSKDSADVMDGRTSVNSNDMGFPSHGSIQRVTSYHASGSDSGNGSGDSAQSSAAGDSIESTHRISGVIIKNPRYQISNSESSTTLKNFDYASAEEAIMQMDLPEVEIKSKFDLENFHTLLLPATENKPLDNTALQGLKMMLRENGPRILANHLTKIDLQTILGDKISETQPMIPSGIELCSLPHGHQMRIDLIERTVCLKLLVAVTILTCTTDTERAETLNKWIEVAIDTKTALGNLFGFCGLMLGLCAPQIQTLDSTWHMLRQKHTDSAFNFEAKLRPTLKSMNESTNPQAPNTTIPHLLPLALLQERVMDDFIGGTEQSSIISTCLSPWEAKTPDFGLTTLFTHLEASRKFNENIHTFKRNAEIILGDTSRTDDLMLDAFRTEFHLKFLWGSRGSCVSASERHAKFEQVLKVLADKYSEPAQVATSV